MCKDGRKYLTFDRISCSFKIEDNSEVLTNRSYERTLCSIKEQDAERKLRAYVSLQLQHFCLKKKTTGIAVQDALDKHFSRKTMNGTLRKN